jgi:predicted regulator of Ras-like GTPase activity (Roadblock/LC7/MglB family)
VVLSRLPASLAASVKSTGGGDLQLPLNKVLAQLPQGVVKISFGELRQAAPPGTFLEVASQDSTQIELPLPEIVARINPSLISRRQDQKVVEVPADVGNVFGPHGETVAPPKSEPAKAAPIPVAAPAPAPAPAAPKPAAPAPAAAPKPILPAAAAPSSPTLPKPPGAAPSSPSIPKPAAPKPPTPSAPVTAAPVSAPKLPTPPSAPKPPVPSAPLPKPPAPAAPIAAPKLPTAPASAPAPASTPMAPITPISAPIATDSTQFFLNADAAAATGTLSVPLSSVSAAWPENVKQDIARHNLKDSTLVLPMANVESGLKAGKIVFSWREIGGWLQPNPFPSSLVGDTLLELPLKVIAPLFIAQHKPAKAQKKLAVGENIPDIFSGGAAPAKPAAPTPVAAAPAPVAPAPAPAAPVPMPKMPAPAAPAAPAPAAPAAKVPTTLGEVFGEAEKKEWGPRDITSKMASVKGLAGGVIVTHDGLMVAVELPAPIKADIVAAFVPQIVSRMNQYAKDLQTGGDVSTMTVQFDKLPLQISKLGKIYFVAVGKAGEPLPAAQLAVICAELAKQNK